jgi:hypothetical protein
MTEMRLIGAIIALSLVLLPGCTSTPREQTSPLSGIWMDQLYKTLLQNSFSPKAAHAAAEIPVIEIDEENRTLTAVYRFHEVGKYAIRNISRVSGRIMLNDENKEFHSVTFSDDRLFVRYNSIFEGDPVEARFVRILPLSDDTDKAVEVYAASVVLDGIYKGDEGKTYAFHSPVVDWNEEVFRYVVWIDFVMFTPMDVLCLIRDDDKRCAETYGFATNGSLLQLYEYDLDTNRTGKLVLELVKQR